MVVDGKWRQGSGMGNLCSVDTVSISQDEQRVDVGDGRTLM